MNTYVVTQKNVYVPENEVLFAYSVEEALKLKVQQEQDTGQEWIAAVVIK